MALTLLTLTPSAKSHFTNLIADYVQKSRVHAKQSLNVRIKAIAAGTNNARVDLSYCPDGEQQLSDLAINYGDFTLYIEKNSEFALKDAIIDYRLDNNANEQTFTDCGKLHINAPFLKVQDSADIPADLDLFNKIKIFLDQKVNPNLARHNGIVKLLAINDDNKEVVLQFGGGCKGCSMINLTLKGTIEKSLKAAFPEIRLIKDATNHAD